VPNRTSTKTKAGDSPSDASHFHLTAIVFEIAVTHPSVRSPKNPTEQYYHGSIRMQKRNKIVAEAGAATVKMTMIVTATTVRLLHKIC
jgi:hypothetical protein